MTSPRVERHRAEEADRQRVRTVNPGLIGKRTTVQRQRPAPRRAGRPYRRAAAAGGLTVFVVGVLYLLGSIAWTAGALTSVVGGAAVSYATYRVELAQVKRTGRPIGAENEPAPPPVPEPEPTPPQDDDLEPVVEPEPVNLDAPDPEFERQRRRTRPNPPLRTEPRRRQTPAEHARTCTANPPGGPTCRCPNGPNRGAKRKAPTSKSPQRKTASPKSGATPRRTR